MKRRTIGIDLDDVLMDFHGTLIEYHNYNYGTKLKKEHSFSFELERVWGCAREEAKRRVLEFYRTDHHFSALPIDGAPEAAKELSRDNDLVIITSKPEYLRDRTIEWLHRHFGEVFGHVCFTNQYDGEGIKITKVAACSKLGVEVFIDDHVDNVLEVSETGGQVFLYDAPWNRVELAEHNSSLLMV